MRSLGDIAFRPIVGDKVNLFGGSISYEVITVYNTDMTVRREAVRNSPVLGTHILDLDKRAWLDLVIYAACAPG